MSFLFKNSKYLTDEVLMTQIEKGDQQAFNELYKRYSNAMLYYFMRMLKKDKEKAEDFVHDLFAKVIKNPASFDASRSFKTWFYSVANNMCKNEYKKMQVRAGVHNGLDESFAVASPVMSADTKVYQKQFEESLILALEDLDEKHRETFTLRHFEEMSIKEIAVATNKSEGTVKSRLFYATKKLAEVLKEFNPVLDR